MLFFKFHFIYVSVLYMDFIGINHYFKVLQKANSFQEIEINKINIIHYNNLHE